MIFSGLVVVVIFSFGAIWLSVEDLRKQSVRNLDLFSVLVTTLGASTWFVVGAGRAFYIPVVASLVYFMIYLFLGLVSRRQLGSADWWGAGILGGFLAAVSPHSLFVGWAMPFAIAFVPAIITHLRKRATRIAFLPYVFGSSAVTILLGVISATG